MRAERVRMGILPSALMWSRNGCARRTSMLSIELITALADRICAPDSPPSAVYRIEI